MNIIITFEDGSIKHFSEVVEEVAPAEETADVPVTDTPDVTPETTDAVPAPEVTPTEPAV